MRRKNNLLMTAWEGVSYFMEQQLYDATTTVRFL